MKADRRRIEQALRAPGQARFFLLHGQDESGSRQLVAILAGAMGPGAERIDLSGADLKADPARLADESASISMFGEGRWILVEQAGDEIVPALEALIANPTVGNPVVIVAGTLKPSSKLLKLALADPAALGFASYLPKPEEGARLAVEIGLNLGLELRNDVARRVADSCEGSRALIDQELVKFAIYLGARPGDVKPLDHGTLDVLGADNGEGDYSRLVDSVLNGDSAALGIEMARFHAEGQAGIPLIRALLRRMAVLTRLRADVEAGRSASDVMASAGKSLFWKEKGGIEQQLRRWRGPLLSKAVSRLVEAEREVKRHGGPGPIAADAELFAICRQATRLGS